MTLLRQIFINFEYLIGWFNYISCCVRSFNAISYYKGQLDISHYFTIL